MPKLIENVRTQLLQEAQRQVAERGYAKTTIRSVADACGIAVGTVYNYFPSKDVLVASFMAETWESCLSRIKLRDKASPKAFLRELYELLQDFKERHRILLADEEAEQSFEAVFPARHQLLRDQLAVLAAPVCADVPGTEDGFASRFVAEALLTWAVEGVPFAALWPYLAAAVSAPAMEEVGA